MNEGSGSASHENIPSKKKSDVTKNCSRSLLHFTTQPQNDLSWGNSWDVHSRLKVGKAKESMKYFRSENNCELCPPTRKARNASNPSTVLLETRTCH